MGSRKLVSLRVFHQTLCVICISFVGIGSYIGHGSRWRLIVILFSRAVINFGCADHSDDRS